MSQENVTFDFVTLKKKDREKGETFLSRVLLFFEDVVKIPVFRCQHCGECLLSHTAFICSQRCPKRLRNGPCGGTGEGGMCEVYPDRKCIWYRIHGRAKFLGRLSLLDRIEKMHNWELEKSSAWLNVWTKRIDPPIFFPKKRGGK
ncbi:MAG: methylenetetrahydrofolate reductase C-terminal domain-containing protein [bacterium]